MYRERVAVDPTFLANISLFQQLHRELGQTVIYVTHDPFIARHTERIIRIADGNIAGDDRVEHPLAAGTPRPSDVLLVTEQTAAGQPQAHRLPAPVAVAA